MQLRSRGWRWFRSEKAQEGERTRTQTHLLGRELRAEACSDPISGFGFARYAGRGCQPLCPPANALDSCLAFLERLGLAQEPMPQGGADSLGSSCLWHAACCGHPHGISIGACRWNGDWHCPVKSVFNAGPTFLRGGETLLLVRVEDRPGMSAGQDAGNGREQA